eukprot:scaffold11032_cov122-Cylindrotheca_fusiformis.AAC.4
MIDVPAREHVKTLLAFYQTAETMLRQAEADVVFAKKRREEARNIKDEAMARLEEAKERYGVEDIALPDRSLSLVELSKRLVRKPSSRHAKQKKNKNRGRSKSPSQHGSDGYKSDDPVASTGYRRSKSRQQAADLSSHSDHRNSPDGSPGKHKSRHSKMPRPRSLGSPGGRRSSGGAASRRGSLLISKDLVSPVLGICKGRSREWYEANIDCESLGLVKRFYQAALGTKTHAASNQIYISSVLLNDEWNDLVADTSEIQDLYIGVSSNSDGRETLRDRAARALIRPPQKEPLAIFFAPRHSLGTEDVYYGGHWRVLAGNMFDPPLVMKGTPRQCLVKLIFSGVDPEIVKAVNAE